MYLILIPVHLGLPRPCYPQGVQTAVMICRCHFLNTYISQGNVATCLRCDAVIGLLISTECVNERFL